MVEHVCEDPWFSTVKICTFGLVRCPFSGSPFIQTYQGLIIYQETRRVICFTFLACVLNPQPLTWFECSLSNKKGFKSEDWGNDNILSRLWIFHFIPRQSKCTIVGQISVFSGLNRRSRRIFSQRLFAIQLLPRVSLWGLTPQALLSSGWSEGELSIRLRSFVWNYIIFSKTLELMGLLFPHW